MTKKAGIMIGAVLAIIAVVAVGCVVLTGGKSETYRSIMVYQVNGDATITRERVGEMQAYENLMLQSGDTVAVASDSSMRLKLDDDKYLLAEQDTLMNIVADGNDADARTYIDLQKGSVTSEIQNKLKDGASYEVNTPNSIMAVRGTIFRVEVEPEENGGSDTKLTVFQGTVGTRAILPDGTISDEEVMVGAGEELIIEGTMTDSDHLNAPAEINYDGLPSIITEYLKELVENGQTLAANVTENVQKAEGEQIDQAQEPQIKEVQELQGQEAQDAELEPKDQDSQIPQQDQEEAEPQKSQQSKAQTPAKPQKKQPDVSEKPQEPKEAEPQAPQQPELPPLESQTPQQPEPQDPQKEASQPNVPNPAPGASDDASSQESGGGSNKKKTQYYTVTFQYSGSTFGTQKVKKGEQATEPKLSPTQNGAWDYDFSQKVTKNIVVEWKAQ